MEDNLFDSIVRHQVQLERAKAGEVIRINKIIKANDKEVLSLISSLPDNYTQRQLNSALRKVKALNAAYYKEVVAVSLSSVADTVVGFETEFATNTVRDFLSDGSKVSKVSKSITLQRALTTPYEGHTLSVWVDRLAGDKTKRIIRNTKIVSTEGGSITNLITSAKKAIRTSNSNNQSVTKVYVNQSANFSRDDVYLANDKFVQEIIWSSILDSGTTITCGVRSNKRYNAKTREPIDHDNSYGEGPGLIHWGCRSLGIPVDKKGVITSGSGKGFVADSGSKTAIGAGSDYERGDNLTASGKRAKTPRGGNLEAETVSARTDYGTWLKTQPRPFIEDSIGVARTEALLSGKAELSDFVVPDGTEISVKQLEKTLNLSGE